MPVACNSRGELLVTEPVIESIPNDVTIDGELTVNSKGASDPENIRWLFNESGQLSLLEPDAENNVHELSATGYVVHRRMADDPKGYVAICQTQYAIRVHNASLQPIYSLDWTGNAFALNLCIALEPDNPANYSPVPSEADAPEQLAYQGPVLDVHKELVFLRSQVKLLMEKLKMVPEGGWDVWDGSAETTES